MKVAEPQHPAYKAHTLQEWPGSPLILLQDLSGLYLFQILHFVIYGQTVEQSQSKTPSVPCVYCGNHAVWGGSGFGVGWAVCLLDMAPALGCTSAGLA